MHKCTQITQKLRAESLTYNLKSEPDKSLRPRGQLERQWQRHHDCVNRSKNEKQHSMPDRLLEDVLYSLCKI